MFSIKIKSTLVSQDVLIDNCTGTSTVEWLKTVVKKELDIQESDKLLRLIYLGRLLEPSSETLQHFNLVPGACVHAFVSAKQKDEFSLAVSNESNSQHRSHGSSSSGDERNDAIDYRGLNRLLAIGMTHEEVAALRATFQSNIQEFSSRSQLHRTEGESEISFRLRVEDDWIAAQGRLSEFAFNLPIANHQSLFSRSGNVSDRSTSSTVPLPSPRLLFSSTYTRSFADLETTTGESASVDQGNWSDFLYGFVVGLTIGFIVIFCVWDRNVPYRQKIGLLAGVMVSSFMGMVQEEGKGSAASVKRHEGGARAGGSESDGGSVLASTYDSSHRHLRFH